MRSEKISLLIFCIILYSIQGLSRPNSTLLYNDAKGIALKGDIDGAIIAFKKVINQNSYYALGHYGLGKAYLFKDGKQKDAIRHLRLSVAYDSRLAKGYFYLGLAYMFSKKYDNAIHSFSTAYEYDKSLVEALYNIAVVYDLMRVDFQANKYYERYITAKSKKDSDIIF